MDGVPVVPIVVFFVNLFVCATIHALFLGDNDDASRDL